MFDNLKVLLFPSVLSPEQTVTLQEMFDNDVAPFQQKYVHLVEDIHNVYGTAKEVSLQSNALSCMSSLLPFNFTFWS